MEVLAQGKLNKSLHLNDANVLPLFVLSSKDILMYDPSLEKTAFDKEGAGQDAEELNTDTTPIDAFCWKMLFANTTEYLFATEPAKDRDNT